MGAADVVPGVSGGTIAFISGIYDELLHSLKSCNLNALKLLFSHGFKSAWMAVNGNFLAVVFGGVILSIISLAKVIKFSLDNYPILVWAFFFGLILASGLYMAKQLERWSWQEGLCFINGVMVAVIISLLPAIQLPDTYLIMFCAGALAICAMILPGISGSFILLLLGLYPVLLQAISHADIPRLICFLCGCVIGLLSFSRLLSALLDKFHSQTMAVLTGFLLGSLNLVWPWKNALEVTVNRHGEIVPLLQENLLPNSFFLTTGQEPYTLPAIFLSIVGVVLVLGLEYWGKKENC
ncbi:MAG: DUF368 domain-containing protein [Cellvibrionaceae bacterium]